MQIRAHGRPILILLVTILFMTVLTLILGARPAVDDRLVFTVAPAAIVGSSFLLASLFMRFRRTLLLSLGVERRWHPKRRIRRRA